MTTKEFKLTSKSQVTIPDTIKEALGISAGDAIVFDVNKDVIRILPFRRRSVDLMTLSQKYKTTPRKPVSLEDMEETIRKAWKRTGRAL
ncbi:MAG: AbrB/MazE/SpoVT family DNA-binding domain-containing protein [Candidatus Omnitrophica bacterium]|nr:AbrB/MazE/SpoVT family DNA-binding domain-containing protein [Candidatus Omnitrophota bacterium]